LTARNGACLPACLPAVQGSNNRIETSTMSQNDEYPGHTANGAATRTISSVVAEDSQHSEGQKRCAVPG
jgi:hypothetical protein